MVLVCHYLDRFRDPSFSLLLWSHRRHFMSFRLFSFLKRNLFIIFDRLHLLLLLYKGHLYAGLLFLAFLLGHKILKSTAHLIELILTPMLYSAPHNSFSLAFQISPLFPMLKAPFSIIWIITSKVISHKFVCFLLHVSNHVLILDVQFSCLPFLCTNKGSSIFIWHDSSFLPCAKFSPVLSVCLFSPMSEHHPLVTSVHFLIHLA